MNPGALHLGKPESMWEQAKRIWAVVTAGS